MVVQKLFGVAQGIKCRVFPASLTMIDVLFFEAAGNQLGNLVRMRIKTS
jgi:hypothetical protein